MIPVTKPFMPPKEEYERYLAGIWEREYLTNNGRLVQKLEKKLTEYLEVDFLSFVSNGTVALQIAMNALEINGEVITTPFSFVATTSSIVWEGNTPVFVDVDPQTFNINPAGIEAAITDKTTAILATHVFGNPCDIRAIRKIADRHDLKVIYDAAHCFGTQFNGKSVFQYGDISIASFHATKLFHTVEGGAVFTQNRRIQKRIELMRNFGHDGPENFNGAGINGKNSEFHAAMGLCNLRYIDGILRRRKRQSQFYDILLANHGVELQQKQGGTTMRNRSYYPVVFESEAKTLQAKSSLEEADIYPRRYFYPSLNNLEYVDGGKMPISENISKRILCLPLYHDLRKYEQSMIVDVMNKSERITA